MQLQHIYLYPIKSTQAYGVEQAVVQPQGLNFDREFMLTEPDGKFITARKDGALYDFSAFPVPFGLQVHHRDGNVIFVRYQDFQQQNECEVWGNQFAAFVAPEAINRWFSEKIGRAVQLRWLGEHSQRRIKRYPDTPLSFADGYPLLLCTRQSFDFLQQACPSPITINRFRPSIVIDGEVPFAEQTWDKIRIGEVTFLHTKPCERCVLTARDPQTKEIDAKMEPFRTLKKINANEEGKPLFGINLIPLNHGIIRLHDSVEVLSYR